MNIIRYVENRSNVSNEKRAYRNLYVPRAVHPPHSREKKMFQHLPHYHYRRLLIDDLVRRIERELPRCQVVDVAETVHRVSIAVGTQIVPDSAEWNALKALGAQIHYQRDQNVTELLFPYPTVYIQAKIFKVVMYSVAAVLFLTTSFRLINAL